MGRCKSLIPTHIPSCYEILIAQQARETFTKKTTAEMWGRNPDRNKYPAAICYNKAYHIRDPKGTEGKVSAKLELGQLFTK